MKKPFAALFTLSVLVLNFTGFALGGAHGVRHKGLPDQLIARLPASDGIAVLDSKHFFNESMPKLLASNQPMLQSIVGMIDQFQSTTGIDLKTFDTVAIGVALKKVSDKEYDFDPVAITRGDLRSGALLAIVKMASDGTYREVTVGTHTIYVFSAKTVVKEQTANPANSKLASAIERSLHGLTREMAVTALDDNTLAFGSLTRVQQTIDGKTHVTPDVSSLLVRSAPADLVFALKTPTGMSKLLPLDNDELGANLDSIRFLFGAVTVNDAGASFDCTARTVAPDQAKKLYDTLDGLKSVGKALLGPSKHAEQQVYSRMIDNAKLTLKANSVSLNLLVPQADIDLLVGSAKPK